MFWNQNLCTYIIRLRLFIEYCSYHKASYICNIPKEFLKRFPPKIVWLTLEINETVIENIFQSGTMTNKQNKFIFIKAGQMTACLMTCLVRLSGILLSGN